MALSIVLGPKQSRVRRPRLGAFAQGMYPAQGGGNVSGWSRQLLDRVWQEPIGGNLMLLPVCLRDEYAWANNFSGEYARLDFGDFGLTENQNGWRRGAITGTRMARDADMTAAAISTATFGDDAGFYLSWFTHDRGIADGVDIEFGYGNSGSATDASCSVALQFLAGGEVNVNRKGQPAGRGSIGGRSKGFQEVIVLPMNLRELLVFSLTNKQGFIQVFEDIAEGDAYPRIAPDSKVWFYRPQGALDFEIAVLRFETTGSAMSTKNSFDYLPGDNSIPAVPEDVEAFFRNDMGGTVAASLVDIGGNAYQPGPNHQPVDPTPGVKNGYRLKVALTGSGTRTPFVQGAVGGFKPDMADTVPSTVPTGGDDDSDAGLSNTGNGVEVRERAMNVRLSVPESPCDVRASFSAMGRTVGTDDALWDLCRLTNLPLEKSLGNLAPFFRGQSGPTPETSAATDEARLLEAEFRDEIALLESVRYDSPYPFDALSITEALTRQIRHARGEGALVDIEENTFVLPIVEGVALGAWSEIARSGDDSLSVLRHTLETYCSTWGWGYFPKDLGPTFRAGSLENHFGSAPVCTLYGSIQDAITIGGHDPNPMSDDAAWRFVYHDFQETALAIEANKIVYCGYDPKTNKVVSAQYTDAESADPTVPPSQRADNWVGETLLVRNFDPRVTTTAAAIRACGILAPRLVNRRIIAGFSSEFMRREGSGGLGQPLWRCDVVELHGKGTYRINCLEADWVVSEPDDVPWGNPRRRCRARYTAAKGAGAHLGTNAVRPGLQHVISAHDKALAERTRVRPGGDFMLHLPVGSISNAALLTA